MVLLKPDRLMARDTVDDISALIHASAPAYYAYLFGHSEFQTALLKAFWLEPENIFSHTAATAAVIDGRLAGVELGFAESEEYALKKGLAAVSGNLQESGVVTEQELMSFGKRGKKAGYLIPSLPGKSYYVTTLSVVETHRGKGVGAQLLENAIETVQSAGYREIHLDVLADNPAVAFYKRMGFECVAETVVPELLSNHQVPMMMRMVRSL